MIALTHGPRHRYILRQTFFVVAFTATALVPVRSDDSKAVTPLPSKGGSSELLDNINASAKGLAGLQSSGGNAWESTREWQHYKSELDGKWSYLNRIRLNAIERLERIGARRSAGRDWAGVSILSAGPDTLYANGHAFPRTRGCCWYGWRAGTGQHDARSRQAPEG